MVGWKLDCNFFFSNSYLTSLCKENTKISLGFCCFAEKLVDKFSVRVRVCFSLCIVILMNNDNNSRAGDITRFNIPLLITRALTRIR